MATIDPNLMLPGQCELPFPVLPLTRTCRIYLPLLEPAVTAGGDKDIGPPQGPGATLHYNGRQAALAERAADVFGGIPLNALDEAGDML